MDSNERKIVQELVTVLGCVIPASDGYEPRTNLWNKYSAAKNLLAAAPQVVADERKAFEAHITDNGAWPRAAERSVDGGYRLMATAVAWNTWRAATDSFVSRSATPVQEPVAGNSCPYCGSTDGAHDKAYPHPRAPVQPVAVPDGWKLVPIVATPEMLEKNNYKHEVPCGYENVGIDDSILPEIWASMVADAPAAFGYDKELTDAEILNAVREHFMPGDGGYMVDTAPECVIAGVRAAIAAKAAS